MDALAEEDVAAVAPVEALAMATAVPEGALAAAAVAGMATVEVAASLLGRVPKSARW